MWSDLATAVGIYAGSMTLLGALAFYLRWDRHG